MPEKKPEWTLDDELVQRFKREVTDHAKQIDLHDEEDWKSLTIGWALAHGLEPDRAREFAVWIRYETDLA